MSIEFKEKQLTKAELLVVKESAKKHYDYFHAKLAATFKKLADYKAYSYAYAFQCDYMQQVLQKFALSWFDLARKEPEAMLARYFDGDVNRYVEKVNDDIAHDKNIITKFYLSFVDEYQIICQFGSNDEEFTDEIQSVVDEAIADEYFAQAPDRDTIKRLSIEHHVDLDDILEEVRL